MALIEVTDIQAVLPDVDTARAAAFIEDAEALAVSVAPCLADEDLDEAKRKAAKAVLRQVVMRWVTRGSGVNVTQQAGPFQATFDNSHGGLFWPSEIVALQGICNGSGATDQVAFAVDMIPECADSSGYWSSSDEWTEG